MEYESLYSENVTLMRIKTMHIGTLGKIIILYIYTVDIKYDEIYSFRNPHKLVINV